MEGENNMISFTKYIHNSKLYRHQNNKQSIVLDLDVVKEKQLVFKTTEVPTEVHRYLDYDPNNGKCYRLVYDDSPSNLSEQ